jgi:hypothetical protein
MGSSQRLREQAARARYYAQHAPMQGDRDAWLAIAERWEHLANLAEADSEDRVKTSMHQQQQQPPKRDDDRD